MLVVVAIAITAVVCGIRYNHYRKQRKVAVRRGMYCTVVTVTV